MLDIQSQGRIMSGQFKLDVMFGRVLNFELLIITCLFVCLFEGWIGSLPHELNPYLQRLIITM